MAPAERTESRGPIPPSPCAPGDPVSKPWNVDLAARRTVMVDGDDGPWPEGPHSTGRGPTRAAPPLPHVSRETKVAAKSRKPHPPTCRPGARRGEHVGTVPDPRSDDHDQAAGRSAQLGHRPALLADPPMVADDAGRQIPWVTSLRAATCDHPSRRLEYCPRTVRSRVANAENDQPVRPPSGMNGPEGNARGRLAPPQALRMSTLRSLCTCHDGTMAGPSPPSGVMGVSWVARMPARFPGSCFA
jgi:hypothetical protein